MSVTEPKNSEILEAINDFATNIDTRLERIEGRLDKMDGRLNQVESTMVTKDYLDDKLADLHGDLVTFVRTEIAQSRA